MKILGTIAVSASLLAGAALAEAVDPTKVMFEDGAVAVSLSLSLIHI